MARIAAIIVLVCTIAVSACDSNRSASERSPSVVGPTPTTPSPTSSPSPEPPAEVTRPFAEQEWVRGEAVSLLVVDFPLGEYPDCRLHAFTTGKRTRGAYETDCRSWETTGDGYELLIFYVVLKNRTDRAIRFSLRDFLLVARRNRASYPPVNVRSQAAQPPNYLPETAIIAPRSNLVGFLTFDGRATIVPARISYVSRDQVLTVRFSGRHTVQ